jgi:hypothetical protein
MERHVTFKEIAGLSSDDKQKRTIDKMQMKNSVGLISHPMPVDGEQRSSFLFF